MKLTYIKKTEELSFITSNARLTFTQSRQTLTKALIFQYFDPKHYIQAKIDVLRYNIGIVLYQFIANYQTSDFDFSNSDYSLWHLIA